MAHEVLEHGLDVHRPELGEKPVTKEWARAQLNDAEEKIAGKPAP